MFRIQNKFLRSFCWTMFSIVMIIFYAVIALVSCHYTFVDNKYEVASVEQYRDYDNSYSGKTAHELLDPYFPEQIEPYFDDVEYVYRSIKHDGEAFESMLEFTIKDEAVFNDYVSRQIGDKTLHTFPFDSAFQEYYISSKLDITTSSYKDDVWYIYSSADVRLILINHSENRIIFYGLYEWDSSAETDYLNVLYTRFGIDHYEYEAYLDFLEGHGDGSTPVWGHGASSTPSAVSRNGYAWVE